MKTYKINFDKPLPGPFIHDQWHWEEIISELLDAPLYLDDYRGNSYIAKIFLCELKSLERLIRDYFFDGHAITQDDLIRYESRIESDITEEYAEKFTDLLLEKLHEKISGRVNAYSGFENGEFYALMYFDCKEEIPAELQKNILE